MNKTLKYVRSGLIILALGALLVYTGIWIGRYGFNPFASRWDSARTGMMAGYDRDDFPASGSGWGRGMMAGQGWDSCPGAKFTNSLEQAVDPLDIHEVEEILEAYIEETGDADLSFDDIMIFDNHAYAQIIETSTGIGAMEVLIDYQTRGVYPEHGPNMMWNLKYSPMTGSGGSYGPGMMGTSPARGADLADFEEMTVSPEDAVSAAQSYLDSYQPGYDADDHAAAFYGYYTLHVLEGGQVSGMLSVNGYSGQVFFHDWHGELLEMSEHNDDH